MLATRPHRKFFRRASYWKAGLTLLELQVAIVLLALAVTGIAAIVVTQIRQLEWSEKRRQIYSIFSTDLTRVVFTEMTSASRPSPAVNRVRVHSFSVGASSITAIVTLEALSP